MKFNFYFDVCENVYDNYQVAKWFQRNLKSTTISKLLSREIQEFENYVNEEHQSNFDKCPHCKVEFVPAAENTVECPRCGLADNKIILMDYHKFTNSYSTPSKQTFDHERHFTNWIYLIQGIKSPNKNIIPKLLDYCTKNKIKQISVESLRQILKQLNLTQYYKYTSYLYKELTDDSPPLIPHDIRNRAKLYFKEFYKAREKLADDGELPKNNPQYSYLIYKIFDLILDKDDEENRRILQFIHLPAETTCLKRDREWTLVLNKFIG